MNKVFKIGLIGCGHIAETYFRAEKYFNNIKIVKCADINVKAAKRCALNYGIKFLTVNELLKDKDQIVEMCTIPIFEKFPEQFCPETIATKIMNQLERS